MNFGQAIEALKSGKRVAREGWNGKNMFIFIAEALHFESKANVQSGFTKSSIAMRTASGEIVIGWLASQTDMLAADWVVVE